MALRLRQACWPSCQPCGTTPTITGITCVSRQGNGNLCGVSKYLNFNDGDWNQRKWKSVNCSGTLITCWFQGGADWACPSIGAGNYFNIRTKAVGTGTASYDPSTCAQVGSNYDAYDDGATSANGVCVEATSFDSSRFGVTSVARSNQICAPISNISETQRQVAGVGQLCLSGGGVFMGSGACVLTLLNPDTVAAALARGGIATGASCRTTSGSTIGSTSAGATGTLAVTGPRSVVATIACGSLVNGNDYTITATLQRYTHGTSTTAGTQTVDITFTASGATASIDYDLPIDSTYDYEITGATIAAA